MCLTQRQKTGRVMRKMGTVGKKSGIMKGRRCCDPVRLPDSPLQVNSQEAEISHSLSTYREEWNPHPIHWRNRPPSTSEGEPRARPTPTCCMVGECFRLYLELKAITSSQDMQRMRRVKARCRVIQRWRGITSTAFSTFLSFVKGKQGETSQEQ